MRKNVYFEYNAFDHEESSSTYTIFNSEVNLPDDHAHGDKYPVQNSTTTLEEMKGQIEYMDYIVFPAIAGRGEGAVDYMDNIVFPAIAERTKCDATKEVHIWKTPKKTTTSFSPVSPLYSSFRSQTSMLALGQACCLVLNKVPNEQNRQEAKAICAEASFWPVYRYDEDPNDPVIMSKDYDRFEILQISYLCSRPPTNPALEPEHSRESLPVPTESLSSGSNTSSDCKTSIVELVNSFFYKVDPLNNELFQPLFLSNGQNFTIMKKHLPRLEKTITEHQFALLLNEQLGGLRKKRLSDVLVAGRSLHVLKEACRDNLMETNPSFRRHIQASPMTNVGYCRKSPGEECVETRTRLLKTMIGRLQRRCFVRKVFVSPSSSSTMPMLNRDFGNTLKIGDGDTQDLFHFLSICVEDVRLSCIDYAGLSNDPDDVKRVIRLYRCIKEVAIDHGDRIEVMSRYDLLHDQVAIRKFKSRTGCVRRSCVGGSSSSPHPTSSQK